MNNQQSRQLVRVSKLEVGQYFSVTGNPNVTMKCYERDEEDKRIIAVCCDPWYHKLAISYDKTVLLGLPDAILSAYRNKAAT